MRNVIWVKRKHEADQTIPPDERRAHFHEYDQVTITTGPTGRREARATGGPVDRTLFEWVEFKRLPKPIRAKPAQRKYEIWVGAYLYFSPPPPPPDEEYEVFFQWDPGDVGPDQSLTIFLYPDPFAAGPPPLLADPPPPPAPPPPETSA